MGGLGLARAAVRIGIGPPPYVFLGGGRGGVWKGPPLGI